MKTMSRQQFFLLARQYFGEAPSLPTGEDLTMEEAYEILRVAIAKDQGENMPCEPIRFTSEPTVGDFDMSTLEYT